jgi:hypothetical protein
MRYEWFTYNSINGTSLALYLTRTGVVVRPRHLKITPWFAS